MTILRAEGSSGQSQKPSPIYRNPSTLCGPADRLAGIDLDAPIDVTIPPREEFYERLKWLDKVRSCPMGQLAIRFEQALAEVADLAEQIAREVPHSAASAWGSQFLSYDQESDTREWLLDVAAVGRLARSMGSYLDTYARS